MFICRYFYRRCHASKKKKNSSLNLICISLEDTNEELFSITINPNCNCKRKLKCRKNYDFKFPFHLST